MGARFSRLRLLLKKRVGEAEGCGRRLPPCRRARPRRRPPSSSARSADLVVRWSAPRHPGERPRHAKTQPPPARLAREAAGREDEDFAHHVGVVPVPDWDARARPGGVSERGRVGTAHAGPGRGCARWLAHETPIVGIGVKTVGTDAGGAAAFDPRSRTIATSSGRGRTAWRSSRTWRSSRRPGPSSSWRRSSSSTGRALRRRVLALV